ncbi:MAG: ABC transporter ATP-binding protein [Candidatus Micrarchaeaceae archaeon]
MMHEIVAKNVVKKFGNINALDNVSFYAKKGISIVLGPNGAGKSTLLKCIDGLYSIDKGSIKVLGKNLYDDYKARSRVSLLTENYALYDNLTVRANIIFFGRLCGMEKDKAVKKASGIMKELDAMQYMDCKVSTLSRGTKQKIAICRSMLNDPEVLLLDEPTAFLDAPSSDSVRSMLTDMGKRSCIIFVTQRLDELMRFDGSIYIIAKGKMSGKTDIEEIIENEANGMHIQIRFAKPIEASKLAGIVECKKGMVMQAEATIRSYKDVNKIAEELIRKGAYIAEIRYMEKAIEGVYKR